uniref:Uncharacterized protein n=1 Tax=Oryza nivara TaxID=4536 RepID=A0A0E0FND7_ORYNI
MECHRDGRVPPTYVKGEGDVDHTARTSPDSPCNPHPLGGHYCRARTTCPAGLVGLNDIDHGVRQVWADTRHGIAGGEHERVHADTFALAPQPHKQHRPAYHAAHFDNNDILLGTHAAIDFYEVDASAAVVSAAAAADATRWPLDDEMVEDDYLDDPPAIDAAAYVTWIRQRSHNIKRKKHLDLVVLGGLVLASYHLLDDALIDLAAAMSTAPERHGDGRAPPADDKREGDVDSSMSFRNRRDCHHRQNCCMFAPFRKNLVANKGIPEAKGVGVRQVTSKELEQEHHCHACPARMDATLVCLPQCLLVTHFLDGKPQSLHAVLRKAFMAFAGLDQGEVINHEAEDVHHDFFPLQDHPALNSPCNPHPLGGHYCRSHTTCPAGLFGLNDIDHGGRQVWADTCLFAGVPAGYPFPKRKATQLACSSLTRPGGGDQLGCRMCTTTSSPSKPNWRSTLPATPTHWGCRCCRARTTCTAGFIGLNNIDHSGRQVWADTWYGVAGAEHERVHAETFALAPQPHQQHRPADHTARFDYSDPFLGTPCGHRRLRGGRSRRRGSPASKAWGSWSTRSSIGGSRTVQVQQQQQPASNFQDNILLLNGDLIANAGREETIVYEADLDALAVDLVDDRSVGG